MNSARIEAIHKGTAYPESLSVAQALFQVWNECEQESSKRIRELEEHLAQLTGAKMLTVICGGTRANLDITAPPILVDDVLIVSVATQSII